MPQERVAKKNRPEMSALFQDISSSNFSFQQNKSIVKAVNKQPSKNTLRKIENGSNYASRLEQKLTTIKSKKLKTLKLKKIRK